MAINRKSFLKVLGSYGLAGMLMPDFLGIADRSGSRLQLIKPPALREGDTIGLVSPAGILPSGERYGEIRDVIRSLGFRIKTGKHSEQQYGYLAGKDSQRASDLNEMFADPDVDAVIPYRGGWGSGRILDKIDYENIKNNPKPLIGFSDITSLLLAIYKHADLVTFHGPVGKSEWSPFTVGYFKQAVMDGADFAMKNPENENHNIRTISPGKAEGRLLGGNLTVLTTLLGTNYLPDFDGALLFIEDIGEDIYRIDRMLVQLKLNGILDRINGFIVGKCTDCKPGSDPSLTLEQVFDDHIKPLGIPAFTGSMVGHIDDIFTIPVGIKAEMDAGTGTIKTMEPAVSR